MNPPRLTKSSLCMIIHVETPNCAPWALTWSQLISLGWSEPWPLDCICAFGAFWSILSLSNDVAFFVLYLYWKTQQKVYAPGLTSENLVKYALHQCGKIFSQQFVNNRVFPLHKYPISMFMYLFILFVFILEGRSWCVKFLSSLFQTWVCVCLIPTSCILCCIFIYSKQSHLICSNFFPGTQNHFSCLSGEQVHIWRLGNGGANGYFRTFILTALLRVR